MASSSRDIAATFRGQARALDNEAQEKRQAATKLRSAADALAPRRGRPRKGGEQSGDSSPARS